MSTAASTGAQAADDTRTRLRIDETTAALVGLYFLLATLLAWQAWRRETPTIFTDELELTQISRAIAETGLPARRGESYQFTTLAPWFTAPFWWIGSVATAYETIKYVQALAMALAIFPTYGIARFVVSRPWALAAAAGSIATPALSYAPILVEEPWAYPIATTALWLMLRAVREPRPATILLAFGGAVAATLTRSQLVMLVAALGGALLLVAWSTPRVRGWRTTWSRGDWVGGAVLALGIALGSSALLGHLSAEWDETTALWKERIVDYGAWAGGAFAIGLGVLPLVALLAALFLRGGDRSRPGPQAFVRVATATVICLGWYAAIKGAYLSTKFSSLIVERNLVYLTPLALAATVYLLSRATAPWWGILIAGGAVGAMVATTPVDRGIDNFPYYEAHGLAILALANREWGWPIERIETAVLVVVAIATLALLAVTLLRGRGARIAHGLAAATVAAVLAWSLTAEIYAAIGEHDFSSRVDTNLPKPNDWVDRSVGDGTVVMLGQRMGDNPIGVASTEFWNRSIKKVWSTDGSAPGPGPTQTPDLVSVDGTLTPAPDTDYVLALNGVEVAGAEAGTPPDGSATLVRLDGPIRLRSNQTGIASDGWAVGSLADDERVARASYNRFDVAQDGAGRAVVKLSRETFCPDGAPLPGLATIRIGPIGVGPDKQPAIAAVTSERIVYVPACGRRDVLLPAPSGPWRVEADVQTFVPAEIDASSSERRELGAVVGFSFVPD